MKDNGKVIFILKVEGKLLKGTKANTTRTMRFSLLSSAFSGNKCHYSSTCRWGVGQHQGQHYRGHGLRVIPGLLYCMLYSLFFPLSSSFKELFVEHIAQQSYQRSQNKTSVVYGNLAQTVEEDIAFQFLAGKYINQDWRQLTPPEAGVNFIELLLSTKEAKLSITKLCLPE